jgi:hypothetical protein
MAADTTGDIDTLTDVDPTTGLSPETQKQIEEARAGLPPETRQKIDALTPVPSALSRTRDKGTSVLAPLTLTVPKEPEKPAPEEKSSPVPAPADKPSARAQGEIFGRQTIFHYNYDGSRDKEDPGSTGFFGTNLDDPALIGAAIPVDILEAQFGKFTQKLPDGTYTKLNTPEASEVISRIMHSHVLATKPDGTKVEIPIVDIQGSYKNWHRVIDLTLGAANALGIKDDSYIGYSIVAGDGTMLNADAAWSDTSPLATFFQQHGKDFPGFSSKQALDAAKAGIAPDMPQEDYERAMRDPNGKAELAKHKEAPKSPGQQLASIENTPYFGLSNDELTKKVYSDLVRQNKIDPAKTDLNEIRSKLFPNPGISESIGELFQDSDFWRAAKPRASAAVHEVSGQFYAAASASGRLDDLLFKSIPGAEAFRQKADQFFKDRFGGHNYFRELTDYVQGWLAQAQKGQEQGVQSDVERARKFEKTLPGKIGGVVGGATGGFAANLPILVPGAPIKSAATVAALFEGGSRFSQAAQKGQSDAFLQGITAAGMGAGNRYLMESPLGRWATGFWFSIANASEDQLGKWLRGEKSDPQETAIRGFVDFASGWLLAHSAPKEPFRRTAVAGELTSAQKERAALRAQVLGPEVSEELAWHEPGPIVSRLQRRTTFTPGELSLAVGEMPSGITTSELARTARMIEPPAAKGLREVHVADPEEAFKERKASMIRAEVRSMQEAKENGDSVKATQHGNRALSLLNGDEQQKLARDTIRFTEKLASNHSEPGAKDSPLTPGEKQMLSHFTGLGDVETLEERPLDVETEAREHFTPEGSQKNGDNDPTKEASLYSGVDIYKWLKEHPEVSKAAEFAERMRIETPETQEAKLYSGLSPAPVVRAIRAGMETVGKSKLVRQIKGEFAPEQLGRDPARMAAIAKGRTSEAKYAGTNIPYEIAHSMRIDRVLRDGEKVGRRIDYFSRFSRAKLRDMLIAHEKGLSTGNAVADVLFKFHDAVYKALEFLEKRAGIQYNAREWYIYHLFKDDQQKAAFEQYYNKLVSSDPRFTHGRALPTWEDVFKAGFEPRYYNPERLLQARIFQSMQALKKIMTLREAEKSGLAFKVDHPGLSDKIKTTWGEPVRAPNGERYYVSPDAQTVLHRAWDQTSLYELPLVGPAFKALSLVKAPTVGLKLGLSFVHARHIALKMNLASFVATIAKAQIHGNLRGQVFMKELERLLSFGHSAHKEVETWQGRRSESTLTPEEKVNLEHAQKAGLDFSMNEERRLQFSEKLAEWLPEAMEKVPPGTRAVIKAGYDTLSRLGMQKFIFGTVVPNVKFSAFLSMRDNLLRNRPDLLQPHKSLELRQELTKIGHEIEARFGEMFYDNLLWRKVYKDLGTSTLLSLGWQLSALRIYGGTVHDTLALAGNALEHGRISRDDLTDRLLFGLSYTALNMVEAGVITYVTDKLFNKGKDPMPKGRDWVFPRVGVDSEGKPKRVAPVEFSRELATLDQHIKDHGNYLAPAGIAGGLYDMARNKLNPVMSTLIQEFENKNFYGQVIRDPTDKPLKQWGDTVLYALQNTFEPISVSAAPGIGQKTGRELTWWDTAMSVLGFPPAAGWTGRTDIENQIVDTFHRLHGSVKTQENIQRGAQWNALRKSLVDKDPHAQAAAQKALADLGVKHPQIKAFETHLRKNPNETYVQHLWKALPASEQIKILKNMSDDERKVYWPLAHKDLRKRYHDDVTKALQAP